MTVDLDVNKIDEQIKHLLHKNKNKLNNELINEIHPNINISYNSLTIAVGRQRSGKTHSIIREIIKISNICPRTHLLIYINKNGILNDPTFMSLKKLIKIPIIFVSEKEAEETVKNILKWKDFYNKIKDNNWEYDICIDQVNQLFNNLKINIFDRQSLHTLIFFEDAANNILFKKSTSFFNNLFTRLAHIQCSVFFAVQYWKSLPNEVKSNVSNVFIFNNFSKQQLRYILDQICLPFTKEQIWNIYSQLIDHQKLIIDINNHKLKVE